MNKKWAVFCAEYLVILSGLMLLLLALEESTSARQMGVLTASGILLIISLALTKVLKRIFHKRRPPHKLFIPVDRYAFPSGHATGLAAICTFILSYDIVLGLISIFIAIIIALARIRSNVHDGYDMIVGACVGMVITYTLLNPVVNYVFGYLLPTFFS